MDPWKRAIRFLILAWFIVINLFVLVPSYQLLRDAESKENRPTLLKPPPSPELGTAADVDKNAAADVQARQLETFKQRVVLYTQAVQAYKERVAAYNKYIEQVGKSCEACGWSQVEVYRLVVKDTLFTLIGATAASLITFVFVSVGGQVVNNYLQRKAGDTTARDLSVL